MKLNQYEWDPVEDKLGEGTFAEVFKAKDIHADRHVALKIYKTSVKGNTKGSTGQSKYSLEQEFQNIQAVSHTNIITYYGLNYLKHTDAMGRAGNHPVIIMEYANQGTLTTFLKTDPKKSTLNKLISDIVKGVGHLHEEGIIHRDLKPGNILVSKNKRGVYTAKIADFGISKDTLSSKDDTKPLTELIGTPHYMAPEQIYQKKFGLAGKISARTDLWAVGVIIYKVFTGKLPFGNGISDIELVHEDVTTKELDLTEVPNEYHDLLQQCLKKNATDRISNAHAMLRLIEKENTGVSDSHLDRTLKIPEQDDEEKGTIDMSEGSLKARAAETAIKTQPPSKSLKIVLGIFGLVNLLWFGYYWFSEENTPYVYLLYPLTIILFCFFYLKPDSRFHVPKFLVYGLIMYYNIMFLMLMGTTVFEGNLAGLTVLKVSFILVFQIGLSIWLIFQQIGKLGKDKLNTTSVTVYLVATSFLVYFSSYVLNIANATKGVSTFFLITDSLTVLTLLPNVFFITVLLAFLFKAHQKISTILSVFFIASLGIASIWWLVLDSENGYEIAMINSYIQELKAGYYLWFISIAIGFSVVLYDAYKTTKTKKFYWPVLGVLMVVLGIAFYAKWSQSEDAYNFNRGVENLDYNQFNKAFTIGKPLKVPTYQLKGFVKKILSKYTNENASTYKDMLKLFVNSSGLVTHITDDDLANAIGKEDPELLKILLNPKGSTTFEDVDFIHEEKSLLQLVRELQNMEMEKLLVDAGAKLTNKEREAEVLKKSLALKAKEFSYLENFAYNSAKFPKSSTKNAIWSYEFGKYKLDVKNKELSHFKTAPFSLNTQETYTVSVKTTRGSRQGMVGLIFDSNRSSYHTVVVGDNTLIIYKNNGKWEKIKQVAVLANNQTNTIKVEKNGNYVSCYLNNKKVVSNQIINSTGGNYMGMINSNPKGSVLSYFDDFSITGTKR